VSARVATVHSPRRETPTFSRKTQHHLGPHGAPPHHARRRSLATSRWPASATVASAVPPGRCVRVALWSVSCTVARLPLIVESPVTVTVEEAARMPLPSGSVRGGDEDGGDKGGSSVSGGGVGGCVGGRGVGGGGVGGGGVGGGSAGGGGESCGRKSGSGVRGGGDGDGGDGGRGVGGGCKGEGGGSAGDGDGGAWRQQQRGRRGQRQ